MADVIISKADFAAVTPAFGVLEASARTITSNAILSSLFTDLSSETMGRTEDEIKIEYMAAVDAQERACGIQGSTVGVSVEGFTLTKYGNWTGFKTDDCCSQNVSRRSAKLFMQHAEAMGRGLDKKLAEVILAAAQPSDDITTLEIASISALKGKFTCAGSPMGDLIMLVGCNKEQELINKADFTSNSVYSGYVLQNGTVAGLMLAGFKVYITSNPLLKDKIILASKEAIGWGYAQELSARESIPSGYGTKSYYQEMDQCYYAGALYLGKEGAPVGKSPFIHELVFV